MQNAKPTRRQTRKTAPRNLHLRAETAFSRVEISEWYGKLAQLRPETVIPFVPQESETAEGSEADGTCQKFRVGPSDALAADSGRMPHGSTEVKLID
jgi:hypothetical protein